MLGKVLPNLVEVEVDDGHVVGQGPGLLAGQVEPGGKWIKSGLISFRYFLTWEDLFSDCDKNSSIKQKGENFLDTKPQLEDSLQQATQVRYYK